MLLTDGNPNDTIALQVYESAILDVAAVETIDLDAKLTLATEEVSEVVLDILLDHTRAVYPESNLRRTRGVSDVVVTAPMKRWHGLHTLALVYRDAFNNQLNDRYEVKWREYEELSGNARQHTMKLGIGLSLNPIPQAQVAVLSQVSGGGAGGTFYAQVSWVSATGQEGTPGEVTALGLAQGNNLMVEAVNPPAVATGFNVYTGTTADTTTLQNSSPIAVGQSFTMPDSGLLAGAAAEPARHPTYTSPAGRH